MENFEFVAHHFDDIQYDDHFDFPFKIFDCNLIKLEYIGCVDLIFLFAIGNWNN